VKPNLHFLEVEQEHSQWQLRVLLEQVVQTENLQKNLHQIAQGS